MATTAEDARAALLLGLPTADLTHFKEVRESEGDEPRSGSDELKEQIAILVDRVDMLCVYQDKLEARLAGLETKSCKPTGTKTLARLKGLREILKQRGPTTFKEMERLLKVSPREMLRLTKKLDNRQYEIFRREGDIREKVIRLRSQIRN